MTLTDLKNQYAESIGLDNWGEVIEFCDELDYHINQIIYLAQQKALENASENAEIHEEPYFKEVYIYKESITNEKNLIK